MSPSSRRAAGIAAAWLGPLALAWVVTACASSQRPGKAGQPSPAPSQPQEPAAQPAKPEPPPQPPAPDECAINRYTPAGRDTVPVAAPAEFVDRQLYETLVRYDCTGRVRPGLAQTWRSEDGGRVWILTLRPDARYWDGVAVTPQAIAASWAADSAAGPAVQAAGILAVAAAGERDLRLTLAQPHDSLPPGLADRALALTRQAPDEKRLGTGHYRPAPAGTGPLTLLPADGSAHGVVRVLATRDLRDALDAGADLVVTDDPATLDYAAARPELSVMPLPWSRTYVLVFPNRAGLALDSASSGRLPETLAQDVVRVDARPAQPPFPWGSCAGPLPTGGPRAAAPSARLGYLADDRTARDLAARIVAIGAAPARSIVGLDSAALRESIRAAREPAYVLAVPKRPLIPCEGPTLWPADITIIPLVETRAHVVVRRGAPPVTVDWDGALRLAPEAP
jgi:hypothetical protein